MSVHPAARTGDLEQRLEQHRRELTGYCYRPSGPGGSFEPWALQVIEHSNGRITGLNAFLDTARLFPLFGLPPVPPDTA